MTWAADVVGDVSESAIAPCSPTSSSPGAPTAPSTMSWCFGAETGRLIETVSTGMRVVTSGWRTGSMTALTHSGTPTVNRSADDTFAFVTIVEPSRTTWPTWPRTSPAPEKNPGSPELPLVASSGLLMEIVDSFRDRSARNRCVTVWPGNSVNDNGFGSVASVGSMPRAPVYTAQSSGRRSTDWGASDQPRRITSPVVSMTFPSFGSAPSPDVRSMLRFHRSPGFEARSVADADLPSLSTTDKNARKVPGTMPSLLPMSMGFGPPAGSTLAMNVVLPGKAAEIGGPTYSTRLPLVT